MDFFFDPGCPRTWVTSRWAIDAAAGRDVALRWRAYSADPAALTSGRTLRVVEAVWARYGDAPIGRLYTEIGTRFHEQGDQSLDAMRAALDATGLDPDLVAAADDERWDAEIRGSMADATAVVGEDVRPPILVFFAGDRVAGTSGPILSAVARGDDGLRIWDAVVALAFSPQFVELRRPTPAAPRPGSARPDPPGR